MRLSGDEVNAGLVVYKRDVLPGDLFPVVLLLQVITCNTVTHQDTQLTHSIVLLGLSISYLANGSSNR